MKGGDRGILDGQKCIVDQHLREKKLHLLISLPFPSPEDLPDPGIESGSPTLKADSLLSEPLGMSMCMYEHVHV